MTSSNGRDGEDRFGFGDITATSIVSGSVLPAGAAGPGAVDAADRIRAAEADRRASMIRVAQQAAEIGLESAPALAAAAGLPPPAPRPARPARPAGRPPPSGPVTGRGVLPAQPRSGIFPAGQRTPAPRGLPQRGPAQRSPGPPGPPAPMRGAPLARRPTPPAPSPRRRRRVSPVVVLAFLVLVAYLVLRARG